MSPRLQSGLSLMTLIVLSMTMLVGILGYYLYQTYETERKSIIKETGYIFINTIQDLEGDALNRIVQEWIQVDSSQAWPHMFSGRPDSSARLRILKLDTDQEEFRHSDESSMDIRIERSHTSRPGASEGIISVFMETSDSISTDSLIREARIVLSNLKDSFHINALKADLNVDYQIIKKDWSDTTHTPHMAGRYIDSASGAQYEVELQDVFSYTIRKIIPEILMSLFVLLCTGVAFFTIFSRLKREREITQQKRDLTQNIAHELKTPVTTISVAMQAIDDFAQHDPVKQREYVDISKRELSRLSLLIDRVLTINKLEEDDHVLYPERIHLNQLIDSIAESFTVLLSDPSDRIHTSYSEPDIQLIADRQQVSGIFYNLIDNAIKYNRSEGIDIQIHIDREQSDIVIYVDDNGPGIPKDLHNTIFESFYRITDGNIHNVKGYGLGLAFVKKAVHQLDGDIKVQGSPLGGARFKISIPQS